MTLYIAKSTRLLTLLPLLSSQQIFQLSRKISLSKVLSQNGSGKTQEVKQTDQLPQPTRVCLVTGGSSGVGYEIVKRLAQDGSSVVTFTTRDSNKGRRTVERIEDELNSARPHLNFIELDLQEPEGTIVLWKKLRERTGEFPPIDTLINCAGLSQSKPLVATSASHIQDILRVNLEVPTRLSRMMLKDYLRSGQKFNSQKSNFAEKLPDSFNIINVSSLLAYRSGSGASVYSASKAGLIALTRTLTLEAAAIRSSYPGLPPFRANSIVPGYIDTPMIYSFSDTYKQQLESEIPLGRFGTPAEIADAAVFLLSNQYANNTVLNLDGGLSAV